jgi:hypothetical protein
MAQLTSSSQLGTKEKLLQIEGLAGRARQDSNLRPSDSQAESDGSMRFFAACFGRFYGTFGAPEIPLVLSCSRHAPVNSTGVISVMLGQTRGRGSSPATILNPDALRRDAFRRGHLA